MKGADPELLLDVCLKTMNAGVVAVDTEGRITFISAAMLPTVGGTKTSLVGRKLVEVFPGQPMYHALEALSSGAPVHEDDVAYAAAGRKFTLVADADVIRDPDGKIIGAVAAYKDVTELVTLKEHLYEANKFRAIGELVAGISHEVRNPLTVVRGFLQLVETESNQHLIETALQELDRAVNVLTNLLSLANPRRSSEPYSPVRPWQLAMEVVELFALKCMDQGVQVVTEPPSGDTWIAGQRGELRKAIFTLIRNAVKAMPEGGTLTLSFSETAEFVVLSIKDTGAGIPAKVLPMIGNPYYSFETDGNGFGLTLVNKTLLDHGGHIKVESQEGVGTAFHLYFPKCADE